LKYVQHIKTAQLVYYLKYRIITDLKLEKRISEELLQIFKAIIIEDDKSQIAFGELEDGSNSLFLFIDKSKIDQIINYSEENNILEFSKEISMDILMDRITTDDFHKTFFKSDEFTYILDNFINDNLTIDIVLDKINESGIDSLKEIDYQVLNSINA